jgi:hypothetical protein
MTCRFPNVILIDNGRPEQSGRGSQAGRRMPVPVEPGDQTQSHGHTGGYTVGGSGGA